MIGVQQVPTGLQVEEAVAVMIIDKIAEQMRVGVAQRRLLLLLTTKDEQTSRNVPADTSTHARSNHIPRYRQHTWPLAAQSGTINPFAYR